MDEEDRRSPIIDQIYRSNDARASQRSSSGCRAVDIATCHDTLVRKVGCDTDHSPTGSDQQAVRRRSTARPSHTF